MTSMKIRTGRSCIYMHLYVYYYASTGEGVGSVYEKGLPPQQDVKVIEMRTIKGYGVRWLHDGSEFRGFLEPQMEGGHLIGWRH